MNHIEKLQAIYDAEINISLSWFWDGGVDAVIGDKTNGLKRSKNCNTVIEAIDWLYKNTLEKVPEKETV